MATTRIMPLHVGKGRTESRAISDIMDSLGEGYGLEDLRAVLSGKKAHSPRKKTVTQAEPPKVNLLVDIQAKLQAGKGAGYAR